MSYVIEKDNGKGNPPTFFIGDYGSKHWGTLEEAYKYRTENTAQLRANGMSEAATIIVVPYDVEIFSGTSERSNAVLSGMEPDTNPNE